MRIPIIILHNVETDSCGRSVGWVDGYRSHHRLEPVFAYSLDVADDATTDVDIARLAEGAYEIGNVDEEMARHPEMVHAYREREVRSVSVGDVIIIGSRAVACADTGWTNLDWTDTLLAAFVEHLAAPAH